MTKTIIELCDDAARLSPRSARMAVVALPATGELPPGWNDLLSLSLLRAAHDCVPLTDDETADVRASTAIRNPPAPTTGWLRDNADFAAAFRLTINVWLELGSFTANASAAAQQAISNAQKRPAAN